MQGISTVQTYQNDIGETFKHTDAQAHSMIIILLVLEVEPPNLYPLVLEEYVCLTSFVNDSYIKCVSRKLNYFHLGL